MLPLLIGTFSFVPMAAADYFCLHNRERRAGVLFAIGCGLLCASTLRLLWESSWEGLGWISAIPMGLAFVSLLLLVYSVFFAVKPRQEDQSACPEGMRPLACRGMNVCAVPASRGAVACGLLWLYGHRLAQQTVAAGASAVYIGRCALCILSGSVRFPPYH